MVDSMPCPQRSFVNWRCFHSVFEISLVMWWEKPSAVDYGAVSPCPSDTRHPKP